ncbi:hypothetical protein [Arthrobacter sp. NPDC058192]|uniref:hypothetical protein n=1 Tax=Arthrobacter sp. NPDC058192 TaxID=3346372 RepID=UPI0036E05D32
MTQTTPILIAMLAAVVGVIIVGVDGGLIGQMSRRWEGYLTNAEAEAPKIKAEAASSPSAKDQLAAKAKEATTTGQKRPLAPFDRP